MNPDRIKYLDISKGFALLLMVIGHCSYPLVNKAIFIFHMPLFFIACGYLTSPFKEFNIKKKINKIIKPYLIVFIISIFPYIYIYGNFDVLWIFPLMKTRTLFGSDIPFGIGPVWFLPCYFFSNLLANKCCKYISLDKFLIFSLGFFTLFYTISKIVNGLPFLLVQIFLGSFFIVIGYKCRQQNFLKSSLFVLIGLVSTIACLLYGNFSMYSVQCRLWIIQLVAGIFCSLVVFECAKKVNSLPPLEWLSKNSLTILCIHSIDWSFGVSAYTIQLLGVSIYLKFFFYCFFICFGIITINLVKHFPLKFVRKSLLR